MEALQLLGSSLGLGLLAGIRLYATVLSLGLAIRFGLIALPTALAPLQALADTRVLIAAAVLYLVEFFADKIPWVDSLWDSVHTLIRPLGAAMLAAMALGRAEPATQISIALLSGAVAFSGHSSKATARLLVNHSPEPFSNIAMSVAEDVFVPAAVWVVMKHPLVALVLLAGFLAVFLWISPKVLRLLRLEMQALLALVDRPREAREPIRCAAGKGVRGLRHSSGSLEVNAHELVFTTRRMFRERKWRLARASIRESRLKEGFLLDRLILRADGGEIHFLLFKGAAVPEVVVATA